MTSAARWATSSPTLADESWARSSRRPDEPDAISVRKGFFGRRRHLVPADAIEQIDATSGVIGLRVPRENVQSFL